MAITIVDNVLLDNDPRISITGGPAFSTTITRTRSGWRAAQANWKAPLWKYKIKYIEKAENFQEIIAFWLARRGPAYAFLIKDMADHNDGGHGIVKEVDGKYWLMKEYYDVVRPFIRNISKPVSGGVVLSGVTGSPVVNYSTGEVTGATSEGTWTGEFYVPVAFKSDTMDYDYKPSSNTGFMEWDVEVEEVRVV